MNKLFLAALAGGVALSALYLVTESSTAAPRGFGGGGGGIRPGGFGGMHVAGGGGFHPSFGGMHVGGAGAFHPGLGGMHVGGMHTFAPHSFTGHAFAPHGFSHSLGAHGWTARSFTGHGIYHGPGHHVVGANRFTGGNLHTGKASTVGAANAHNALTSHHLGTAAGAAVGAHAALAHSQIGSKVQPGQHPLVHSVAAHNQFVAQHFQGLNKVNTSGFNRNTFGSNHAWNQWGARFWGAGWHSWGGGWGCWAGPVFWPFLYGDIFAFTFWPDAYYDPFWWYGPTFVLVSIFAPGPYWGPDYGYGEYYGYDGDYGYADVPNIYYYRGPRSYAGSSTTGAVGTNSSQRRFAAISPAEREELQQINTEAMQSCAGLAPDVIGLPIDQIRQTVNPQGEQATTLDELATVSTRAGELVKASCPSDTPLTPVARLDKAAKRLQAMLEAVHLVWPALAGFYASLSDEQRQRFDTMGKAGAAPQGIAAPQSGNLAALCNRQSGDFTKVPVERIEQLVQPTPTQQDAFNDLKQATRDAANQIQGSCPTALPHTPLDRLDAVGTRLGTMVDAMGTLRPKLEAFYSSLTDEQKARFNTMGPPPNAAAELQNDRSGR
jgi:hypothetical protein